MTLSKNKKGQFYIFTALILIAYTATLLSSQTVIESPRKTVSELNENFVVESAQVVNTALFEGKNASKELNAFTDQFIAYAKTKGVDLQIFFIIGEGNTLFVSNKLKKTVSLLETSQPVGVQQTVYLAKNMSQLSISAPTAILQTNLVSFNITNEQVQIKSFVRFEKNKDSQVFVNQ